MNIWEATTLERQNLRASLEGLLQNLGAKAVAASELAGKLGIPLGTIKSWLRRSLLTLRECLQ